MIILHFARGVLVSKQISIPFTDRPLQIYKITVSMQFGKEIVIFISTFGAKSSSMDPYLKRWDGVDLASEIQNA
ncbi:MAG: hypothetical protein B1H40_04245 [Candidatus Latescibacteria bacterium 4484_181]|nr:MAG: hypothetical protein B1H40_04245 [Candidatus Latescibacteria bacterium 4484_181]RKY68808.1 MAG: hypothetical protein DRQ02_03100 [Candidatus Latescibacterota bacterium]